MAQQFASKDPGETISYSFNLKSLLGLGETISSATASISYYSGLAPTDTTCQTSGTVAINNTFVSQIVTGGVNGNIYELVILVVTSAGQTFKLCGLLPVVSC